MAASETNELPEQAPSQNRRRSARFLAAASMLASLVAAERFAHGVISLGHPLFAAALAVSVLTLTLWVVQLALATRRAARAASLSAKGIDAPEVPKTAHGAASSPIARMLIGVVLGLVAMLIMQLADRNGGAGHLVAVLFIVVALAFSTALSELVIHNRWRSESLAGLAGLLVTATATYPSKRPGDGLTPIYVPQPVDAVSGWLATVGGAITVAMLASGVAAKDDRLAVLSGRWNVGPLQTVRYVNLTNPTGYEEARWTFETRPGCNEFSCTYRVRRPQGRPFVLRPAGRDTWTGVMVALGDCVSTKPPYSLVRSNAYRNVIRVEFALSGANTRRALVRLESNWTRRRSVRERCGKSGNAIHEGDASLVARDTGRSVTPQPGPSAGASPATGSVPQPEHTKRRLSPSRRAADGGLHGFVQRVFNQPVSCRSTPTLPRRAKAQLKCEMGRATVVVTRLVSPTATTRFLSLRYRQAFPFAGSAGKCSSSGTLIGTWQDATGRTRGPWGARRIHGDFEVLWGYLDSATAFVARGDMRRAVAVCNVWYAHSG